MGCTKEIGLQVAFHDLDPLQIVWHGNYLKYFEIAREALLEDIGLDFVGYFKKSGLLFPIVRQETKHIFPLRYRDRFRVKTCVTEAKRKIVMAYEIHHEQTGKLIATGRTEQVAIVAETMKLEFTIPEEIQRLLGC